MLEDHQLVRVRNSAIVEDELLYLFTIFASHKNNLFCNILFMTVKHVRVVEPPIA